MKKVSLITPAVMLLVLAGCNKTSEVLFNQSIQIAPQNQSTPAPESCDVKSVGTMVVVESGELYLCKPAGWRRVITE